MGPEGRSGLRGRASTSRSSNASTRAGRTRPSSTSSAPASRLPVELEGDIYSLCACNDAGAKRLVEMMDEFAMDSLDPLADFIFDSSPARHPGGDRTLPQGTYRARDQFRRLRGAGHAERGDDHPGRRASRWITPAPPACRRAASTCRRPIAAPIPASASSASWRPRSPTTGPAWRRSA